MRERAILLFLLAEKNNKDFGYLLAKRTLSLELLTNSKDSLIKDNLNFLLKEMIANQNY